MKKNKSGLVGVGNFGLAVMILIFLLAGLMIFYSNQKRAAGIGYLSKENCVADDCLMVEGMEYPAGTLSKEVEGALTEALMDEYNAYNFYQKVIGKLGMVRPFSMIVGAEEQHIATLKTVFIKYGLTAPKNSMVTKMVVPATVTDACLMGVEAEKANIKLYKEKLLPAVSGYDDISMVFTNLMNASEQKHLVAFERCN